ncbi:MAG: PLP-dependent aminotransferase family protein, partial [bacterium]|nr:PLP-dependent aminotransferase family protein [bacterium]
MQSIKSYGGVPVGVELDEHGMIPEKLEETLNRLEAEGRRPRLLYIIPDFQNPAGVTIPLERRKRIVEIARERDYLIVEDTPYRQIRFEGEHQQTFQALAPERVVSLYTFSKIMLPGFRLGWAYGPEWLIDKFVMAKQSMDLCTPPFNQAVTYHMLENGALEAGLKETIKLYNKRCRVMLDELEKNLGDV